MFCLVDRKTERVRETDRQTETETERQRETETQRDRERHRHRHRELWARKLLSVHHPHPASCSSYS